MLLDRLLPTYTLESWLGCWAKTKWQRILAGIREERLFLERSNAFAGGDPDDAREAGGEATTLPRSAALTETQPDAADDNSQPPVPESQPPAVKASQAAAGGDDISPEGGGDSGQGH